MTGTIPLSGFEFLPQINVTSIFTAGTFATVLVALIKAWPIIALQVQKAKEKLRAEGRSDLTDCQERLDRMGERLDQLYETLNNLKIEMAGVLSAFRILELAEERRDPTSIHLAQSRAVLSAVFTVAPSTHGAPPRSSIRRAAEETSARADDTAHAAHLAVNQVKKDETEQ